MSKIFVIVPAYNEADGIAKTLAALRAQFAAMPAHEMRLCVIDDGSTDDTRNRAQQAGADFVLVHKRNRGLGATVRTGLKAGRDMGFDIVVKFDADLQHDPADIPALIVPILDDEADIVYGNRLDRIEYAMPLVRRFGNAVFTALMRWLTGWSLRDSQPGMFAVGRAYLECFFIPGDYNYTQQVLLDAYHKGMRFRHVSIRFSKRLTGSSFVTLRYPTRVLAHILMVLISVRPMRVFVPVGAFFMVIGFIVFSVELAMWLTGHADKPVEDVNLVLGSTLFGLQTLFFGLLAELIVQRSR